MDQEEKEPCNICLDHITSVNDSLRLPCGHVFHLDCLNEWAQKSQNEKVTCPKCRAKISKDILQELQRPVSVGDLFMFVVMMVFIALQWVYNGLCQIPGKLRQVGNYLYNHFLLFLANFQNYCYVLWRKTKNVVQQALLLLYQATIDFISKLRGWIVAVLPNLRDALAWVAAKCYILRGLIVTLGRDLLGRLRIVAKLYAYLRSLLVYLYDRLTYFVDVISSKVKAILSIVYSHVISCFQTIYRKAVVVCRVLVDNLTSCFRFVRDKAADIVKALYLQFTILRDYAFRLASSLVDYTKTFCSLAYSKIRAAFLVAYGWAESIIISLFARVNQIWQFIKTKLVSAMNSLLARVNQIWQFVKTRSVQAIQYLRDLAVSVVNKIGNFLRFLSEEAWKVVQKVGDAAKKVGKEAVRLGRAILEHAKRGVTYMITLLKRIYDRVGTLLAIGYTKLADAILVLLRYVRSIYDYLLPGFYRVAYYLRDKSIQLKDILARALLNSFEFVKTKILDVFHFVSPRLVLLYQACEKALAACYNNLRSFLIWAIPRIARGIRNFGREIGRAVSFLSNKLHSAISMGYEYLFKFVDSLGRIVNFIVSKLRSLAQLIYRYYDLLANVVADVLIQTGHKIYALASVLYGWIVRACRVVYGWIVRAFDWIDRGFRAVYGWIDRAFRTVYGWIDQAVRAVYGWIDQALRVVYGWIYRAFLFVYYHICSFLSFLSLLPGRFVAAIQWILDQPRCSLCKRGYAKLRSLCFTCTLNHYIPRCIRCDKGWAKLRSLCFKCFLANLLHLCTVCKARYSLFGNICIRCKIGRFFVICSLCNRGFAKIGVLCFACKINALFSRCGACGIGFAKISEMCFSCKINTLLRRCSVCTRGYAKFGPLCFTCKINALLSRCAICARGYAKFGPLCFTCKLNSLFKRCAICTRGYAKFGPLCFACKLNSLLARCALCARGYAKFGPLCMACKINSMLSICGVCKGGYAKVGSRCMTCLWDFMKNPPACRKCKVGAAKMGYYCISCQTRIYATRYGLLKPEDSKTR